MKTTGIVRRIDELGRIVIPKEVRKRLKIDSGDMVDIFVDNESVILSKYHPLCHCGNLISDFCDSLKDIFGSDIIVTDNHRIIYNSISTDLNEKELEKEFLKRIDSYKDCEISAFNKINITNDYSLNKSAITYDVSSGNEHFGYLLILDDMISKKQKDLASLVLNYLNKIL